MRDANLTSEGLLNHHVKTGVRINLVKVIVELGDVVVNLVNVVSGLGVINLIMSGLVETLVGPPIIR